MNFVFICASVFGLRCLETCLRLPEVRVTGIVTGSQTFAISYRPSGVTNVLHADVAGVAQSHAIPVRTLERAMNEPGLLEAVAEWEPDAFLVAGWYHMIPRRWRELAPAYGLHASLLPDYSGGAPLVWAMINGETRTGITLFQMDDGVDSGPIAEQVEEPIHTDDTIATLYARIEERGMELLESVLPQLAAGKLTLRTQDESHRQIVPQRSPEDGRIDWCQSAAFIDRWIRAQTSPYPGAFSTLYDKKLSIWKGAACTNNNQVVEPGLVERIVDDCYRISCGDGAIEIKEVTYDGQNYKGPQLVRLFEGGGQTLGDINNCLKNSRRC